MYIEKYDLNKFQIEGNGEQEDIDPCQDQGFSHRGNAGIGCCV